MPPAQPRRTPPNALHLGLVGLDVMGGRILHFLVVEAALGTADVPQGSSIDGVEVRPPRGGAERSGGQRRRVVATKRFARSAWVWTSRSDASSRSMCQRTNTFRSELAYPFGALLGALNAGTDPDTIAVTRCGWSAASDAAFLAPSENPIPRPVCVLGIEHRKQILDDQPFVIRLGLVRLVAVPVAQPVHRDQSERVRQQVAIPEVPPLIRPLRQPAQKQQWIPFASQPVSEAKPRDETERRIMDRLRPPLELNGRTSIRNAVSDASASRRSAATVGHRPDHPPGFGS